MNSFKKLQAIREALLIQFGSVTVDRQVCERISIEIFTINDDYVSTTTLMRLFGLLPFEIRVFPPAVITALNRFVELNGGRNTFNLNLPSVQLPGKRII